MNHHFLDCGHHTVHCGNHEGSNLNLAPQIVHFALVSLFEPMVTSIQLYDFSFHPKAFFLMIGFGLSS